MRSSVSLRTGDSSVARSTYRGGGIDQQPLTGGRAPSASMSLLEVSDSRPVVVDMGARAAVCLSVMVAIVAGGLCCERDGLLVDYESECREYVRCAGGQLADRYMCGAGRVFSEVAAACVSRDRQPCVRRTCGARETAAYAAPGTACRHYYRCENSTAVERACPSGAWFDSERQACTQGAGACYEPLCAGLPDGEYPDASHECRRRLVCAGGRLRGVVSGGKVPTVCPPPRSSSAPLPAGDASFCADEACSSLCKRASDGAHADRSAGCREYFVCEAGRAVRRGACEPGFLFSGQGCEPASSVSCPPAARGPCYGRADGVHRDWRNCSWWFDCRRERVQGRGRCAADHVWDGERCVSQETFPCSPPEPSARCAGRPTGMYQDLESDCARYYHCEGGMLTALECPDGLVFDGARCSSPAEYVCPSLERESCYGKPDGRYRSAESGCRGYYACMDGEKAVYACPPGHHFDGTGCSPAESACPRDDYSCAALSDGYHAELDSDCRRYFYCEGGDRLATLSCIGGKIFDGRSCVSPEQHMCGAPPQNTIENGGPHCERDGFFVQQGTECRTYYFCVTGMRTFLSCPTDKVFNGQVCVSRTKYSCPG